MEHVETLRAVGFVAGGRWRLMGEALVAELDAHASARDILYAFVAQGRVLYLGVSTRTLAQRMRGYIAPGPSQQTNLANHARLRAALAEGAEIAIWVLAPSEPVIYNGVALNIAAGLEGPLIALLQPPWNRLGRSLMGAA